MKSITFIGNYAYFYYIEDYINALLPFFNSNIVFTNNSTENIVFDPNIIYLVFYPKETFTLNLKNVLSVKMVI